MDDIDIPQPEDSTAVEPEAVPEADPATAVESDVAAVSGGGQGEQDGDLPVPKDPFEDDDNEGWEDMEDLAPAEEAAEESEAAVQEAASAPNAASEVNMQEVKLMLLYCLSFDGDWCEWVDEYYIAASVHGLPVCYNSTAFRACVQVRGGGG